MNRKAVLAVAVATAVTVLGLFLPRLVVWQLDQSRIHQVRFAPMGNVELEFSQNEVTLSQALVLHSFSQQSYAVPEYVTKSGIDKIHLLVNNFLGKWENAGLLPKGVLPEASQMEVGAILADASWFSPDLPVLSNLYWSVSWSDGGNQLTLLLDDFTGAVVYILFYSQEPFLQPVELTQGLDSMSQLYLDSTLDGIGTYDSNTILQNAVYSFSGDSAESHWDWEDPALGRCTVRFSLSTSSISVYPRLHESTMFEKN